MAYFNEFNEENNNKLSIIKSIKEAAVVFENNFPLDNLKRTNFGQQPSVTLLTCSDSRVPEHVFGESFNRIFSVENIGNQVKTSEGSLLYGLLHLCTPLMMVVGHSDCGAIKAAGSNFSGEPEAIVKELGNVKRSLEEIQSSEQILNEEPVVKFTQLAELNVDMQVKYLCGNTSVAQLIKDGNLLLVGMMLDLHNVYGQGYGKSYLINCNGVRDTRKLMAIDYLSELSVGRLTTV